MKFETKYNIDQVLYYMYNNKIVEQSPVEIEISLMKGTLSEIVNYRFLNNSNPEFWVNEVDVFATKQELLNYLNGGT